MSSLLPIDILLVRENFFMRDREEGEGDGSPWEGEWAAVELELGNLCFGRLSWGEGDRVAALACSLCLLRS